MPPSLVTGAAVGAAGAALLAGGLAYATWSPASQIFGHVVTAGHTPWEIALTYDDGPNPAATPQLLDLLTRHGVTATFFLIGAFVRREPALARAILHAGHVIGNHSMTHPKLAWQSASRVRRELHDTNILLEDVLGARIRHFRPPFGVRRPYVLRAAHELGLTTVQWNVTAYDWKLSRPAAITQHVEQGIVRNRHRGRGSNILLHDGSHHGIGADRRATIAATAGILATRRRELFVTVDAWTEQAQAV